MLYIFVVRIVGAQHRGSAFRIRPGSADEADLIQVKHAGPPLGFVSAEDEAESADDIARVDVPQVDGVFLPLVRQRDIAQRLLFGAVREGDNFGPPFAVIAETRGPELDLFSAGLSPGVEAEFGSACQVQTLSAGLTVIQPGDGLAFGEIAVQEHPAAPVTRDRILLTADGCAGDGILCPVLVHVLDHVGIKPEDLRLLCVVINR